jgi:hypothetical protein
MKRDFLFDTEDELKEKLLKLKFASVGVYRSIIEENWKWFNSPKKDGDFQIKNGWLEDNLGLWIDMFKLRPKAPTCSMNMFWQEKMKNDAERAQNMIFQGENGVEILK